MTSKRNVTPYPPRPRIQNFLKLENNVKQNLSHSRVFSHTLKPVCAFSSFFSISTSLLRISPFHMMTLTLQQKLKANSTKCRPAAQGTRPRCKHRDKRRQTTQSSWLRTETALPSLVKPWHGLMCLLRLLLWLNIKTKSTTVTAMSNLTNSSHYCALYNCWNFEPVDWLRFTITRYELVAFS